ncbi:MAG: hypothetical protein ACI9TH_004942, partial [Kiritimatiellia bacterium]
VGQTAAASMPVQPLIEHIPGGFGLSHPKALTLTRTCGPSAVLRPGSSSGLPVDFRWTSGGLPVDFRFERYPFDRQHLEFSARTRQPVFFVLQEIILDRTGLQFHQSINLRSTDAFGSAKRGYSAAGIDTGHVLSRQALKPSQSPVSMFRPRIRGRIYRKITLRWVIFLMK